jgi:hypothetical protein
MDSFDKDKITKIALGILSVGVLFKGIEKFTKKTDSGFELDAEKWNKDMNAVPIALDFFCASEILKVNNNIEINEARKKIQTIITNSEFGFLIYERKETKALMEIIAERLQYYSSYYNEEGSLALRREVETLEDKLLQVSQGEYKKYLTDIAFKAKLRGLMELPNAEKYKKIRVRFAPNPNGPLSMGHSFGIIINNIYAKTYDAEYILRYDDTDPDNKVPQAQLYEQIKDEFEFLTDRTSDDYKLYVSSENADKYIGYARKLIEEGKAYVSYIPHQEFAKKYQMHLTDEEIAKERTPNESKQGIASPDRNKPVWLNLKQFDEMVETGTYREEDGTMRKPMDLHLRGDEDAETILPTVWLKTPLNHGEKSFRDMKIMRATYRRHPSSDALVFPYLNFQGAIDDHDLKITHMIRGADLWKTERAYPLIWKALGWNLDDLPVFMYWPRLFFENFSVPYIDPQTGDEAELRAIGTSKLAKLVRLPEFGGNWCNPYFPTVCSYMAKGYPASYLTDFWLGDVWGKEFMSFNGEKEGKFKALTKPKGMSRCMMYIGWKKLGTFQKDQLQVPYPLTEEGELRDTPSITLVDRLVGEPMPHLRVMQSEY